MARNVELQLDILEIVDGSKTYQMRGLLKVRRSY